MISTTINTARQQTTLRSTPRRRQTPDRARTPAHFLGGLVFSVAARSFLAGAVRFHPLLARPLWMNVLHKRHVLVDQLMHVRSHQVLGVLVDVLLVHLLTEDGRPAGRATADANAQAKLEDRDDRKREAPTAHGLAAEPRPEEASHEAIDERADAADAGHALDARNTPGSNPTRLFRPRLVALCCLCSSGGGTATCATAADYPIEDYHAAKNSAHHGVRRMRLAAPHSRLFRPRL